VPKFKGFWLSELWLVKGLCKTVLVHDLYVCFDFSVMSHVVWWFSRLIHKLH